MTTSWDAKLYNTKHDFVFHYGSSLIELLKPKKDELILDLGCGAGQLTEEIAKSGAKVMGMDASESMIESASNNFPELEFRIANAESFDFAEKFDAIFSNATLHWVKNYKAAVANMFQHLNESGRLIIEFGGKGNVQKIEQTLKAVLKEKNYSKQANINLWFFPSIAEYSNILEETGFEVRLAELYDRPTKLADEKTGIKDWISMFGKTFFEGIPENDAEIIKNEVQNRLKPELLKENTWYADYRRLRIIAYKNS
ncbi:methyltransferase domain-containing protein [Zunongwangia sp. SCSIO 43204]|uniref:class I SAM-dependent methyltransferase n=1 Tax=Zunongwangia sp. SCSIO 43204 TaxID=2779359 RepID=UPI001CA830D3|nr:class I SAM-dependent methyltransferase [Zunongwangia sp. SCSIO 43204]UAB84040.1 methyltransferase domain-containing protein [Zunongwangia sp. SCSIO 43204]